MIPVHGEVRELGTDDMALSIHAICQGINFGAANETRTGQEIIGYC